MALSSNDLCFICAILIKEIHTEKRVKTMKLHEKIKKLLIEKGWSQNELSDKIGIHTTHFNRLER